MAGYASAQNNDEAVRLIQNYYNNISTHDWDGSTTYWSEKNRPVTGGNQLRYSSTYETLEENSNEIYNIQNLKVIDVYEYDRFDVISNLDYSNYREAYGENLRIFLIQMDLHVHTESVFNRNGISFRVLFLGKEDDQWKILMERADLTPSIVAYAYPEEERNIHIKRALELLELNRHSVWANMDGK